MSDFLRVFFAALVLLSLDVGAESLYSEETFQPYVSDYRAHRVGDVVTLLIVEASEAASSEDGEVEKGLGVSGGFGKSQQDNDTNNSRDENAQVNFALNANGSASTQRSGNLRAQMTAEVKKVDEAGKLFVKGKQRIVVNGEEQMIQVSGWLRPQDVSPQNSALSLRLTDAKIQYTGDDADTGRPGLIRRIGRWFKRLY